MDKTEMFARRIVSLISEGNTKETFDADVLDVAVILREFAQPNAAWTSSPSQAGNNAEGESEYRSMKIRMENGAIVNTEKAVDSWEESTWWNGSNWISRATGSQWEHQRLYKSRKNRYYIICESQWQGVATRAEWLSEEDAARWLLTNLRELPADLAALQESIEE